MMILYVLVDGVCDTCENGIIVGNDVDGDGVCDDDEVFGCTDPLACNYDELATENDGTCLFVDGVCETCENGIIVDNDIDGDGVCDDDEIEGCTDSTACNFDASATEDDGSCYNNDLGCGCDTPAATDGYDCDGNCLVDTDGDGVCDEFEVIGCTDATACNYDSNATDTGDCDYSADNEDCDGNCLAGYSDFGNGQCVS